MPDQHVSQNGVVTAQVIHVLGSYQVYTMPVFDMIEHQVLPTPNSGRHRLAPAEVSTLPSFQ